jgi:Ser/Thr protein kinase RdoA (MazF antagonist)
MSTMNGTEELVALVERVLLGETPAGVTVERRALRGGLTARRIAEVRVRYGHGAARRTAVLVVKHLPPQSAREATVYEQLLSGRGALAPGLVHVARTTEGIALVLERIRRANGWPWRDAAYAAAVLAEAARLHAQPLDAWPPALAAWDYERELAASAEATVAALEACPTLAGAPRWTTPAVRRVAAALPALRAELLPFPGLAPALVHGDLHPGNVLLHGRSRIVLLDWERARIGSPLEDVASWLVSLGHHEPEARRRHDTLLGGYLAARGLSPRLVPRLRRAYWIAAASNALAGALRYHLVRSGDPAVPEAARLAAGGTARAWLRVLRRADAWIADAMTRGETRAAERAKSRGSARTGLDAIPDRTSRRPRTA